jgi:hypothetical protein
MTQRIGSRISLPTSLPAATVFAVLASIAGAQTGTGAATPLSGEGNERYFLIGGAVVLLLLGGWFMFMWRKREPIPRFRGGREVEASNYEQVTAELQGIRLRISGGDGRAYLPKVERLIHIFADRMGVIGARTMDAEALTKALAATALAPEQIKALSRMLSQCHKAKREETGKLDFDPLEMVQEFQAIVREVDREESS